MVPLRLVPAAPSARCSGRQGQVPLEVLILLDLLVEDSGQLRLHRQQHRGVQEDTGGWMRRGGERVEDEVKSLQLTI